VVEESSSDEDGCGDGDFDDEKTSLKPESEAGSILETKVNIRKKKKTASVVNPKNKPRRVMNVSGKELIISNISFVFLNILVERVVKIVFIMK
jgi:hypothetical protein